MKPDSSAVEKAIRSSVYASVGVGLFPCSLVNTVAVTAANMDMARKLSKLYGVEFKEDAAKKLLLSMSGAAASSLASLSFGLSVSLNPLKNFPFVMGSRLATNAATTYALGRMLAAHFEKGGGLEGEINCEV